jgi:sirohydrochlorin ferrochelatase
VKASAPIRAVVLVDHGSRERAANAQLARIARALRRRLTGWRVAVAHLSLVAPDVAGAIDACVARGAREIVVVPYFLAPGRHATRDVPRLARAAAAKHAGVRVRVAAALGVHPGLVEAVCDRVRAASPPAKRRARGASRAGSS